MVNSQTFRMTPGPSSNSTLNSAKSTWACRPGGVSKGFGLAGRAVRRKTVTTLLQPS